VKKAKRRVFLKRVISVLVIALVSIGVSRDGRIFRYLRQLRDKASSSRPKRETVDHLNVPEVAEYIVFLRSLGLQYFSPEEIVRPHHNLRNGVRNNIPPKQLWGEITHTLRVADELRDRLGARAEVLSVYRSPAYNTAINGASRSQHVRNRALDLKFSCSSDEAFAIAEKMREEGIFSGGIGRYSSFIHIDTRGYDATW